MALDKQSCLCPPPFLIVEDLCGPFPPGCVSGQLLPDNTAVCALCDITKNLVLVGTSCQCKNGFQFDLNGVCQDICGDGLAFESECDDGNTQSGDGCSSSCLKENTGEFKCDFSVTPTVCKSERMLKYEIKSIMKQENENSVFLTLSLSSKLYFPFPIKRDQLFPLSFGIKLKIILSESPWQEHIVTDHELIEVTEKYDLLIEMPYSFSL
jgi:cysteine-rich repeat protein